MVLILTFNYQLTKLQNYPIAGSARLLPSEREQKSRSCWYNGLIILIEIVLTGFLVPVCHAQKIRFSPVSQVVIQARKEQAPASQSERAARIKQLFVLAGCARDQLGEQTLPNLAGTNVICRFPGKSQETIVVGANYNETGIDNWTGASLLPSLLQSLAGRKRRHTFVFVAFADGSQNLAGSNFFAAEMAPGEVEQTEAMVNLGALGFSPTKIATARSDKQLVKSFMTVTYALKYMASQVDLAGTVSLDSEPFAARQIPGITIHSLTQDAVAGLQPSVQPPVAVPDHDFAHFETGFRLDLYYHSYKLISGYLAYLDETLGRRHRP